MLERRCRTQPFRASASLQSCLSTTQVVGRAMELRVQTQCCLKFRNAVAGVAGRQESQCKIVMSIRTVGIQPQRLVKLVNSLRESTQAPQRDSKVVTNVCVFWCQL